MSRIDLRSRRLVASTQVGPLPLFAAFGYGSAWVSNYHGSSVSVVRPGSAAVETVAVGRGPLGIAAGEGAVWVVSYWDRTLTRIDPETRRVVERVRIGAGPLSVAAGAGAVWVTNRDDRTVVRVDPRTNRVVRTIRLAASPHGIRVAHGRVWVTTQRVRLAGRPLLGVYTHRHGAGARTAAWLRAPARAAAPRIGSVDAVALEERRATLAKRSIKRDSKLQAYDLAVRMMDLTTLEGADTPGKVAALCSKAMRPDPVDSSVPSGRRRLRLPEPRRDREGAARRLGRQGRVGRDGVPVRPVAALGQARRRARGGRARAPTRSTW